MLITFDLDGVLMRNPFRDGVFPEICRMLAPAFGGQEQAVMEAVVAEYRRRLRLQDEPGSGYDPVAPYDWDGVVAAVARARGVRPPDEPLASLVRRFAREDACISFMHPSAPGALRQLREAGHELAAVTNGLWAYQEPVLQALGILDLFGRWAAPDRTGRAKPDPEAFYAVCGTLRAPDAVHVGDDLLYDVAAARRAGLLAIWVIPPRLGRDAALREAPPWERPSLLAGQARWQEEIQRTLDRRAQADRALVPYCRPDAAVLHVGEVPEVVARWRRGGGADGPPEERLPAGRRSGARAARSAWRPPVLPVPELGQAIVDWFAGFRRDLPWRRDPDPYRVLVSEFMLQQTQVATVIPFFEAFVARFPTVERLAAADEQEVLEAWQGLGYYRRARMLHETARRIVARHGGRVPDDPAELRRLPGVGPYMAGAIASIAYGRPAAAIDGNAARVLSRLLMLWEDPRRPAVAASLDEWVKATVPPGRAGEFTQGLMELGSRVCRPRPRCSDCPVRRWCSAWAYRLADELPPRRTRPRPEPVEVAVAWVSDGEGRVLLVRRDDDGLLGGLWGLPALETPPSASAHEVARQAARVQAGVEVAIVGERARLEHTFSHRRWVMRVFSARALGPATPPPDGPVAPGIHGWATQRGDGRATQGTGGQTTPEADGQAMPVAGHLAAHAAEHLGTYPARVRWADSAELARLPIARAFRRVLELPGPARTGEASPRGAGS